MADCILLTREMLKDPIDIDVPDEPLDFPRARALADRRARERLARLMGLETVKEFEAARQAHARNVRQIFNRLLKLPEETLVYPAHDYKGETVSTIGEERAFNPRLQVKSAEE